MVGDWPETTLGELCKKPKGGIQTGPFGSQLHRSDYLDIGVPVIMPTNIRDGRVVDNGISRISEAMADKLKRHRVKVGDIIFSRRGEVDKCAVVTEREVGWLCGTGCLLARVDPLRAAEVEEPERGLLGEELVVLGRLVGVVLDQIAVAAGAVKQL